MLRLPAFEFVKPESVDETLELMQRHGARCKVVAGGTDLIPNMKHRLFEPKVVIGLSGLEELRGIRLCDDGAVVIGAMTTLEECESSALLLRRAPGLAQAAHSVGGPSQRTMGTIGGNVCLDTRCVWYNQTHFWRKSLGYCLKKDGSVCHVVEGGRSCVAAASNDTGTMLTALNAELLIQSKDQKRTIKVREFYKPDGIYNLRLKPEELLTQVIVPPLPGGHHSGYSKLRPRQSIDFPKLSVAACYTLGPAGTMIDAEVVISAIAAVPRIIRGIKELAAGRKPRDAEFLAAAGERARKATHPLTNLDGDADYRREMIPVFVRRAFLAARS